MFWFLVRFNAEVLLFEFFVCSLWGPKGSWRGKKKKEKSLGSLFFSFLFSHLSMGDLPLCRTLLTFLSLEKTLLCVRFSAVGTMRYLLFGRLNGREAEHLMGEWELSAGRSRGRRKKKGVWGKTRKKERHGSKTLQQNTHVKQMTRKAADSCAPYECGRQRKKGPINAGSHASQTIFRL